MAPSSMNVCPPLTAFVPDVDVNRTHMSRAYHGSVARGGRNSGQRDAEPTGNCAPIDVDAEPTGNAARHFIDDQHALLCGQDLDRSQNRARYLIRAGQLLVGAPHDVIARDLGLAAAKPEAQVIAALRPG